MPKWNPYEGVLCERCKERRWPTAEPKGPYQCQRCTEVLAGGHAQDPLEVAARTKEQYAAAEYLRQLPGRYRVTNDLEGWPIIPGRAGQIEYDGLRLAVFTDRPRMIPKLLALPGVSEHQTGDTEARMPFAPEALSGVANLIGAKRRRVASPSQVQNLVAGAAYRFTSGPQKETLPG